MTSLNARKYFGFFARYFDKYFFVFEHFIFTKFISLRTALRLSDIILEYKQLQRVYFRLV